jgi:hypothetical protein
MSLILIAIAEIYPLEVGYTYYEISDNEYGRAAIYKLVFILIATLPVICF